MQIHSVSNALPPTAFSNNFNSLGLISTNFGTKNRHIIALNITYNFVKNFVINVAVSLSNFLALKNKV